MEWNVRLLGDDYDLEDLSKVCNSEELTIVKNEDSFVLKSTEFNNLIDGMEVYKKAEEIVTLVNGASMIILGLRNFLRASRDLIKIDDQGRRNSFFISEPGKAVAVMRGSFQGTLKKANGSTDVVYQASPVQRWVHVAKENKKVASVLKMLSDYNLDWNKLNIIFEEIEDEMGSSIHKNGWASEKDIDLFTHTVQSYRHGESKLKRKKWIAPQKPMEFHRAKALIQTIVSKWIDSKIEE
jgi:hypothetical protein